MQRQNILAAVRARYGIPTNDGLLDTTTINGLIDRAVKDVELADDWPWLETTETINTVASTTTSAVATTYVRTISCRIGESGPMLRLTLDEADHWGETNEGTPKAYAFDGRTLRWIPTPDGVHAVRHRFVRTETALAGDTSEPLCPEPWIEAVIARTGVLCAHRENDLAAEGARKAEYDRIIERLIERAGHNADTTGGGQKPPPVEA